MTKLANKIDDNVNKADHVKVQNKEVLDKLLACGNLLDKAKVPTKGRYFYDPVTDEVRPL